MWSVYQQIRLIEVALDRIETDIRYTQTIMNLISDMIPESNVGRKAARLEQDRQVARDTLAIYRRQMEELKTSLVS